MLTGRLNIDNTALMARCMDTSTDKTIIMYFTIVPDLAPKIDSDYFKKRNQEIDEKTELNSKRK